MSTETEALTIVEETAEEALTDEKKETNTLKVIGWVSLGVAVAALGVYVGHELFSRYKFNRRTPYDFYAHASEQPGEFGVGI